LTLNLNFTIQNSMPITGRQKASECEKFPGFPLYYHLRVNVHGAVMEVHPRNPNPNPNPRVNFRDSANVHFRFPYLYHTSSTMQWRTWLRL